MSRNDDPPEVVRVGQSAESWLAELGDDSVESLREYRVLPLMKVIQSMTKSNLKDQFGEGSVLMMPGATLIAPKGHPFLFVPLVHFTEFCKWSDIKDTGQQAVVDRTFDQMSELAQRCRDPKTRFEPYGQPDRDGRFPYSYRYAESLNFPGFIYGEHELVGLPVVLSFSRGEFFTGTSFCSAILMRRVEGAQTPLWSQVWELRSSFRERDIRRWYGVDFRAPDQPYIRKEEVDHFRSQHRELRELVEKKRLIVDRAAETELSEDDAQTEM